MTDILLQSGNVVTPAWRVTPLTNEITKTVRQNYRPPSPKQYKPAVVQCRTGSNCKAHKSEDYWLENYRRRRCNLHRGFHSQNLEPYRLVGGDLILDPYELVLTTFKGQIKKDSILTGHGRRRGTIAVQGALTPEGHASSRLEGDDDESKEDSDEEEVASGVIPVTDTCPTGGFENIRKYLDECRRRKIYVQAGLPYEEHVKMMEEEQKSTNTCTVSEKSEMSIQSLSTVQITKSALIAARECSTRNKEQRELGEIVVESPSVSPSDVASSTSYMSERPESALMSEDSELSVMSNRSALPPRDDILKTPKPVARLRLSSGVTNALLRKERQFKNQRQYLEAIFSVLLALTHMKNKDLRSKVPLSKEMVKNLRKEFRDQHEADRSSRATNYVMSSKQSKNMRMQSSVNVESVVDQSVDTPLQKLGLVSTTRRAQTMDSIGAKFMRRKSRVHGDVKHGERPPLETWEDFLNVQPQEYKELEDPSPGFCFQAGIVSKFMRWYRRASITPTHTGGTFTLDRENLTSQLEDLKENAHTESKETKDGKDGKGDSKLDKADRDSHMQFHTHTHVGSAAATTERSKKLPIWQQVAQEKSTVFLGSSKKKKVPNPDTCILRFRNDMARLKQSLQKENNAQLEKLEREKIANFRLKFETLQQGVCHPVTEQQLQRVHQAAENVDKSHLENFDIQPSKWYEMVKEESTAIISGLGDPSIQQAIQKLQRFSHMDNKTIPYAKAKLCLLMMSMPAYDICQIPEQRALKFVFEHILLGQDDQFLEWLSERKMPYVVVQTEVAY